MGRDLSRNNGPVAARTWNPGRSAEAIRTVRTNQHRINVKPNFTLWVVPY
jgi:hypothetical protein